MFYQGVLRSHAADYLERTRLGYGGYSIRLNATCILDCYDDQYCKCSMANSSFNAVDESGDPLHENVCLHISTYYFGLVTMKAKTNLLSNTEIFYDYGEPFVYPDGLNDVYV